MPVQMFRPRVALPAPVMRALELLVQPLPAPPPLLARSRRAIRPRVHIIVVILVLARPPPSSLVLGRRGPRSLRSLHGRGARLKAQVVVVGLGTEFGRMRRVHGEDLGGHGLLDCRGVDVVGRRMRSSLFLCAGPASGKSELFLYIIGRGQSVFGKCWRVTV